MELKSSENTKLYGMDHFFNEITKLYNEKKMPTKILLSGKKGLGKSTLAYHLINYFYQLMKSLNTILLNLLSIKTIDHLNYYKITHILIFI